MDFCATHIFFFFWISVSALRLVAYWRLGGGYTTGGGKGRVVYIVPSFVYSLRVRVAHSGQRCVETGSPDHAGLCKWGCKLACLPLFVDLCARITPPQANGHLKGAVISWYYCCCPFPSCLSTCLLSRKSR